MSAAELIERYQIKGCVASFIMRDVETASKYNMWAEEFRLEGTMGRYGADKYGSLAGEVHFRSYRGQARAIGWRIAQIIDGIVRAEEELAARDASNGQAHFWQGPCGDETCGDCDRPLWHHIEHDSLGRLCPMGRRFWQLARELVSEREYTTRELHKSMLGDIARRP